MKKILFTFLYLILTAPVFAVSARYFKDINSFLNHELKGKELILEGYKEINKETLHQNYCYMFIYDDQNRLITIHYLKNARVSRLPGREYSTIKILYQDDFEIRTYEDQFGNRVVNEEGISIIRIKLDQQGRYFKAFYYDEDLVLNGDSLGIAMRRFYYDESGKMIKQTFSNSKGGQITNLGYTSQSYQYSDDGYLTSVSFLDASDVMVKNNSGFARLGNTVYLSNGNTYLLTTYYNDKGNPAINPQFGVQAILTLLDRNENIIQKQLVNISSVSGDSLPYSLEKRAYDAHGYLSEVAYYDRKGDPVEIEGVYRTTYKRDKFGNVLERISYNRADEMMAGENGVARTVYTYNNYGEVITIRFFGIDDLPCTDDNGIGQYQFAYNKQGMMTKSVFLDQKGRLIDNNKGFAIYEMVYDDLGRVVQIQTGEC